MGSQQSAHEASMDLDVVIHAHGSLHFQFVSVREAVMLDTVTENFNSVSKDVVEKLFHLFAPNSKSMKSGAPHSGSSQYHNFIVAATLVAKGCLEEKLNFILSMFDPRGQGFLKVDGIIACLKIIQKSAHKLLELGKAVRNPECPEMDGAAGDAQVSIQKLVDEIYLLSSNASTKTSDHSRHGSNVHISEVAAWATTSYNAFVMMEDFEAQFFGSQTLGNYALKALFPLASAETESRGNADAMHQDTLREAMSSVVFDTLKEVEILDEIKTVGDFKFLAHALLHHIRRYHKPDTANAAYKYAQSMYDFTGTPALQTIDLAEESVVRVLNDTLDSWWYVETGKGAAMRRGYAPAAFLKHLDYVPRQYDVRAKPAKPARRLSDIEMREAFEQGLFRVDNGWEPDLNNVPSVGLRTHLMSFIKRRAGNTLMPMSQRRLHIGLSPGAKRIQHLAHTPIDNSAPTTPTKQTSTVADIPTPGSAPPAGADPMHTWSVLPVSAEAPAMMMDTSFNNTDDPKGPPGPTEPTLTGPTRTRRRMSASGRNGLKLIATAFRRSATTGSVVNDAIAAMDELEDAAATADAATARTGSAYAHSESGFAHEAVVTPTRRRVSFCDQPEETGIIPSVPKDKIRPQAGSTFKLLSILSDSPKVLYGPYKAVAETEDEGSDVSPATPLTLTQVHGASLTISKALFTRKKYLVEVCGVEDVVMQEEGADGSPVIVTC
eukprot:GFYU01005332.1.p1 GENE.GFYU01005332.1~~GFYU01005332.1.p1  ORF type:complete len:719 (-),score=207.73 GFYU01005332.1:200-2356(-)